MTVKELFEGVLTEVRKEQVPHIQLYEFNHYANEAASDFVDDVFMAFETNQKSLDMLKAIKKTIVINTGGVADPVDPAITLTLELAGDFPDSHKFTLPSNYRHLTGLIVNYNVVAPVKVNCYLPGDKISMGSRRLDSERRPMIVQDPFQRPRFFRPYHAIIDDECIVSTGVHPGMDITSVVLDYIKTPNLIAITQDQAFSDTTDTSDTIEFDDIAARRIMDKIVTKILERNQDPRTGGHAQINQPQLMTDVATNLRQQ